MTKTIFPIRFSEHGSDVTTLIIDKDENGRSFRMCRDLLPQASKYFEYVLNDGFEESFSSLGLPNNSPFAFEVLYQWRCSGEVMTSASWYTEEKLPTDLS